jgi:hypothetical protein
MHLKSLTEVRVQYNNSERSLYAHGPGEKPSYKYINDVVVNYKDGRMDKLIDDEIKSFYLQKSLANEIFYKGIRKKIAEKNIGPNLKRNANRYNEDGQMCLYLADSSLGVYKEIQAKIWYEQEYQFDDCDLRIANLADNSLERSNLNYLFFITENGQLIDGIKLCQIFKEEKESGYYLSRRIANIFRIYKWDGLFVHGVRGSINCKYKNLCIFESGLHSWKNWAKKRKHLKIRLF